MSTDVQQAEKTELKLSPMYKVILHNDDKTPMDFVIAVLCQIFGYDFYDARDLMLTVHNEGYGVAGVFTLEIAEDKKDKCTHAASAAGYPFKVSVEEDS